MVSDPRPLSAPEPVTRQLETILGALRGDDHRLLVGIGSAVEDVLTHAAVQQRKRSTAPPCQAPSYAMAGALIGSNSSIRL